jgi:hypothetical protein
VRADIARGTGNKDGLHQVMFPCAHPSGRKSAEPLVPVLAGFQYFIRVAFPPVELGKNLHLVEALVTGPLDP